MKVLISGGGTGGHVYPALSVVPVLKQQRAEPDLLWVGTSDGLERPLVERANIPFTAIPAGGLRGKNPLHVGKSLWQLGQGYRHSHQILRRFQPDALLVTGGYVCVPVTLAAWRQGIPIVIYLPDVEPGFAIKFLSRFATQVAVSTPESQQFFPAGLTTVTGYPVRAELLPPQDPKGFENPSGLHVPAQDDGTRPDRFSKPVRSADQQHHRQKLGLDPAKQTLLVFGGSRGARSINHGVAGEIERYLAQAQVIHITGRLDYEWVLEQRQALPELLQADYHVFDYLHEPMISALRAADLVISRAGASVLGEFPILGLPAVLVPYPHAGAHQTQNAIYLVNHQAAILVDDVDITRILCDTVINIMSDSTSLAQMSQAAFRLARPSAAVQLAQTVLEVKKDGD